MSSSINTLSKWNDKIISFLENPIIKYGFLILIIIQIIMIEKLSTSYLSIFDDNLFKVIYAFLIAYYACFDPIYAIALTTLMIISIQEIHNRNATHNIVSLLPTASKPSTTLSTNTNININPSTTIQQNLSIKSDKLTAKIFDNDELVYELINKNSLQKQPSNDDKITSEYDFCHDPAYKTITDNIKDTGKIELLNKSLNDSLMNIQNNENLDIDQNKSLQGLQGDILNIQGLPNGFDLNNKHASLL